MSSGMVVWEIQVVRMFVSFSFFVFFFFLFQHPVNKSDFSIQVLLVVTC